MKKYGLVLLASETIARNGGQKQLPPYNHQTLLKQSLQVALESTAKQTIVVTGANAQLVKKELINSDAYTVYNSEWKDGIASSIKCGLSALIKVQPDIDAALFMVCDQPYITTHLLNSLMSRSSNENKIAASVINNTLGIPAAFPEKYFPELFDLSGDDGAKEVLKYYAKQIAIIPINNGYIDIDTPIDYESLLAN